MPRKRAAFKRVRADKKRQLRNQSTLAELKTRIKKIKKFIEDKNTKEATSFFKEFISKIDKAKNKGIIHKKTASRWISRISKRIHSLTSRGK